MTENHITDECSSHKYFTQIANIIFHLGLSAFEIALYMTLKRTAGSRNLSKKGTKRLALESGMSIGKIVSSKEKLCRPRKELNGKSLITIKKTVHESGGNGVDHIFLTDIWEENHLFFSETIKKNSTYSPHEPPYSPHEPPYSPHEPKNNLNRNNLNKNIEDTYVSSFQTDKSVKKKTSLKYNRDKKEFDNMSEEFLNSLKKIAPTVNIKLELERIKDWLDTNPKGKKMRAFERFIKHWIKQEEDKIQYNLQKTNYNQNSRVAPKQEWEKQLESRPDNRIEKLKKAGCYFECEEGEEMVNFMDGCDE